MRPLPFALALSLASASGALTACSSDGAPASAAGDPPAPSPIATDAAPPSAESDASTADVGAVPDGESRADAHADAAHDADAAVGTTYRLPWTSGTKMELTQDCKDPCCNDHVGDDAYAWDFGNGGSFLVVAARGGTITHLKIDSTLGCGSSSCVDDANYIVIDHGDGTQSTYLHLTGSSLQPGVACGGTVTAGQPLAMSGTTGWSSGIHLHYQVNGVHPGVSACECGTDGQSCAATSVPWSKFWVTGFPTIPISFVEWPDASQCAARRIPMPSAG